VSSPPPRRLPTVLPARAEVALLLGAALLLALYVLLRYQGLWGEGDTYELTIDMRSVLDSGRLEPPDGLPIYPNGYGYQALAAFLLAIAGLSLANLQIYGAALLVVWNVAPAWLAYRSLTGSVRGATLATIVLLVQPEYLFPLLRGTHEKFTRGLIFLAIYLFMRLAVGERRRTLGSDLLLYAVTVYTLLSFNNLLANSVAVALAISAGLLLALSRFGRVAPRLCHNLAGWLIAAAVVSIGLSALFTFYAYRSAQHDLAVLGQIGDHVAALIDQYQHPAANPDKTTYNPYAVINTGWISPTVYIALSLANWLILVASAAIWIGRAISWVVRRRPVVDGAELLLWSLWMAFALEVAASVFVDLSGALVGNLQHRMFPTFVMLAAPMVASWLVRTDRLPRVLRGLVASLAGLSIAALALLSVLKATNEPLLSNKWLFYLPAEEIALDWADTTLSDRLVWAGLDERLATGTLIRRGAVQREIGLDVFSPDAGTRDFLVSDLMRAQSARIRASLPLDADMLVTYDNGQTQIEHLRPKSPYQR
jgi:hypothetical protein